ncbi:MAG: transporter substrate-binding domain-containing protein [Desulfobacterales bacterium]|jgi:polar amino acid transport system substrate-binding protein
MIKKTSFILAIVLTLTVSMATLASAGKSLNRILQKGELVVGITGTQPPLNATSKDGKIIGFDADIAKSIALNMGVRLKFFRRPFAELLPALEAGKVDMVLSSMTMTLPRNLKAAFVGPYYISGKGILTKTDKIGALQKADGLNKAEFKVAALKGSTSQEFAAKAAPKANLVTTSTYGEAVEMLLNNQIDALIADYPFCAFTAFRYEDKGLIAGQSKLTFEPLGIAVSEDTLLINWLQNFMMALEGSGQLKALNQRWFKDGSWIKELEK